jgi:hypothetical protein
MSLASDLYSAGIGGEAHRGQGTYGGASAPEVTSLSFQTDLGRVVALVESTSRDVESSRERLSQTWLASYAGFLTRFGGFTTEHPIHEDYSGAQIIEAQQTLATYADEIRRWRQSLKVAGGALTDVPDLGPSAGRAAAVVPAKKSSMLPWILGGLAAIVATLFVVKSAPPTSEG